MRKKMLAAQNLSLFEELERLRGESVIKDKRIKELEKEIERLKSEPVAEKIEATVPLKRLEEKIINNSRLDSATEYGSEVIGKLVMESAAGSNKLTSGGNTEHMELVNLLLGKTEVAKAQILEIVSMPGDFGDKKDMVDKVAEETLDYFNSILAQLN